MCVSSGARDRASAAPRCGTPLRGAELELFADLLPEQVTGRMEREAHAGAVEVDLVLDVGRRDRLQARGAGFPFAFPCPQPFLLLARELPIADQAAQTLTNGMFVHREECLPVALPVD